MLREIYCKPVNDPTLQSDIIEHSDIYETLLCKLRMILFTDKGTVLGEPTFGSSLNDLIFETKISGEGIKEMIYDQIKTYIPESEFFNIKVEVNFKRGATSDLCFIDVKVNDAKALGILLK